VSPFTAGKLATDLRTADTQIEINLFLERLAPSLFPPDPFTVPTQQRPGSIWLGGERIEYFGYAREADVVTLSGLRRATRGTAMMPLEYTARGVGDGSAQLFTMPGVGSVIVTVNDLAINYF